MKTFSLLNLTGCTGCSVSMLNAFNDNPEWLGLRLRYSPFLMSVKERRKTDVLLVQGGVGTTEDHVKLTEFAELSKEIVVIGTCASFGFISSFGNYRDVGGLVSSRLDSEAEDRMPHLINRVRSVGEVVEADKYIPGCPPAGNLIGAYMMEEEALVAKIVCVECTRKLASGKKPDLVPHYGGLARGPECLLQQGHLCLGLVTQGGCGAPCPRNGASCIGCRGPAQTLMKLSPEDRVERVIQTLHRRTTAHTARLRKELTAPSSLLFLYPFSPEFSRPPGYVEGNIL